MVSAPARRELVRHMISHGLSERHSLRVIGMSASAYRYEPTERSMQCCTAASRPSICSFTWTRIERKRMQCNNASKSTYTPSIFSPAPGRCKSVFCVACMGPCVCKLCHSWQRPREANRLKEILCTKENGLLLCFM